MRRNNWLTMRQGTFFEWGGPYRVRQAGLRRPALHHAIVIGAILAMAGLARAEVIEQILVKVNGEVFSKTDLENRQLVTLRQRGQPVDLKSGPSDQQLRKVLDEITPQLMVDAINEMVVV